MQSLVLRLSQYVVVVRTKKRTVSCQLFSQGHKTLSRQETPNSVDSGRKMCDCVDADDGHDDDDDDDDDDGHDDGHDDDDDDDGDDDDAEDEDEDGLR